MAFFAHVTPNELPLGLAWVVAGMAIGFAIASALRWRQS
jgi:hypothetical protein